ncbi:hypothetical protein AVEN_165771-1 [Araneus ventricosus]|uniref:Uncharacterized protein n=1 Tax=Araneus ventricosus TaxID=182803 RepID=A0A4Y2MXX9_ARAVE|nr:hypothetical protein AVEN_165771-1 [Araneus ventricosus]
MPCRFHKVKNSPISSIPLFEYRSPFPNPPSTPRNRSQRLKTCSLPRPALGTDQTPIPELSLAASQPSHQVSLPTPSLSNTQERDSRPPSRTSNGHRLLTVSGLPPSTAPFFSVDLPRIVVLRLDPAVQI